MVVLTIVAQKNDETVYFDEPIPQAHFTKLNLNRVEQINLTQTRETLASIPGGHYTLHGLVKELKSNLEQNKNKAGIKLETNNSSSILKLTTQQGFSITHGLAALLGTGTILDLTSHVSKINTPSAYFIHCDLIDKNKNFFNGKKSDVFSKFDIRGLPYDKVSYFSLPQYNVLKEAVRAELTRQPSRPDVEKIRKDVRDEVEKEYRKILNALVPASN